METPIADGLFTWPDPEPSLIGGRCTECGRYTFPLRPGCPSCGAQAMEQELLARQGTLWSWTSQGFAPKLPYVGEFKQPWYVGLVELPGQLRLESVLVDCDQASLEIGQPMRLVITPFRHTETGDEIVTFAFQPESTVEGQRA
jgi:uncharacterized OB-fold protein